MSLRVDFILEEFCCPGKQIPYFLGYKTELLSYHYNPENLDPSYKMDLDHWIV